MILADVNNQYWKDFKDISISDLDTTIDEIIKRAYQNLEPNKILYYSFNSEEYV